MACKNVEKPEKGRGIPKGIFPQFLSGMHYGWSVPMLPKLLLPDSKVAVTPEQWSWMLSAGPVVSCLSGLLIGVVANAVGRKPAMILTTVPFIAGWLTVLFASSWSVLFVGRCLSGAGTGMSSVMTILYPSEVVDPRRRGTVVGRGAVAYYIAMVITVVLATYVQYDTVTIVCLVFPSLMFLVAFLLPETPYFLLLKKRKDEAWDTLTKLRTSEDQAIISNEFSAMEEFVNKCSRGSIKDLILSKTNRRGFTLGVMLNVVYICSGMRVIQQYGTTIFQMSGTKLDPEICTIVTISSQLLTLLIVLGFEIPDRVNRRILVLGALTGIFVILVCMGTYFYLHEKTNVDLTVVHWMPLLFSFSFIVLHGGGLGSTKSVLCGEMISAEVKSVALGFMTVAFNVCDMITLKMFQTTIDYVGVFAALWIYAGCTLVGDLFFYFLLPETRGKSFLQIHNEIKEMIHK